MSENVYVAIGKRIRAARLKAGLTQQDVADQLKLTNVGFGAFERGDRQISVEYLVAIADILGHPVTYFLGIPEELTTDEKDLIRLYRAASRKTRTMVKYLLEED